jgi:hypothetical protein
MLAGDLSRCGYMVRKIAAGGCLSTLAALVLLVVVPAAKLLAQEPSSAPVSLGQAALALTGPWQFQLGDDLRWAQPAFDDSAWEKVDLTPKPGAHDGDVGLTDYVPGWSARGHKGYTGFAWYRLRVSVERDAPPIWLAGPALVDNGYELYFNGQLLGGSGDLSQTPPVLLSIRPQLFAVPRELWASQGTTLSGVIALRVLSAAAGNGPEGGGIHIAPVLGTETGVRNHYRLQWLEKVEGYVVDAAEPVFFLILAVMALATIPFDPAERFNLWMAAALTLLAVARFNQPLFWLGHFETLRDFVLWRLAIVDALTLGAWVMAWRAALGLSTARWIALSCAGLTVLYVLARILGNPIVIQGMRAGAIAAGALLLKCTRLGFLALLAAMLAIGARRGQAGWTLLLAVILGSVGLFAPELGQLGVPGIWFPFGVGVSRTEYAYAAFDVVLFVYLLQRLWRFAPPRPAA